MWLKIILLSVTVSLDGFGAGMACAFKGQRITFKSKLVIAAMAVVMMSVGNAAGVLLRGIVPERVLPFCSGAIFMVMGITTLIGSIRSGNHDYDLDRSEKIEGFEGVAMGFSLDADCLLAGMAFGGSIAEGIALSFCVAIMQSLFIFLGELLVRKKCSSRLKGAAGGIISGLLFIFIAILQFL